jgi:phospholipase C
MQSPGVSAGTKPPGDHRVERARCARKAGELPKDTLAADEPHGQAIPIDHFVVLMQENHSFDNYFEMLPQRGQPDAEVAPADFSNPDPSQHDQPVPIHHAPALCQQNPDHGWNTVHQQYADGALNGFVASSNPGGARAMGYYDEPELPYYYALANAFAIGDHYFSSLLGPTYPNRMYALSGTSFGFFQNGVPAAGTRWPSIFTQLQKAHLSWLIYADDPTFEQAIYPTLRSDSPDRFATLNRFIDDAAQGRLPELAWVEASYVEGATGSDEHPPSDVQIGQQLVARVVDAVMHGPQWQHTALLLTYDEAGGYFDHVAPPPACAPDHMSPKLSDTDQPGNFDRLGMRVPLIVVSPYARAHYVSHEDYSHTSILRLVQARFELPALSARDANSTPLYDLFDFEHPAFAEPPTLPEATVDADALAACIKQFPVAAGSGTGGKS